MTRSFNAAAGSYAPVSPPRHCGQQPLEVLAARAARAQMRRVLAARTFLEEPRRLR